METSLFRSCVLQQLLTKSSGGLQPPCLSSTFSEPDLEGLQHPSGGLQPPRGLRTSNLLLLMASSTRSGHLSAFGSLRQACLDTLSTHPFLFDLFAAVLSTVPTFDLFRTFPYRSYPLQDSERQVSEH